MSIANGGFQSGGGMILHIPYFSPTSRIFSIYSRGSLNSSAFGVNKWMIVHEGEWENCVDGILGYSEDLEIFLNDFSEIKFMKSLRSLGNHSGFQKFCGILIKNIIKMLQHSKKSATKYVALYCKFLFNLYLKFTEPNCDRGY
ncbi:hypothetical protein BpHYR1_005401 [Brachionus plicatilis]|uniref:Uncharacterized protein n=1 Tax=Brachionus plicatilis TaxID=10195 RepID=A0A3M7QGL5_BRAPC|nr:hypothetical protein BpHYR1_005401 [Brachionus plicatilis]